VRITRNGNSHHCEATSIESSRNPQDAEVRKSGVAHPKQKNTGTAHAYLDTITWRRDKASEKRNPHLHPRLPDDITKKLGCS